MHYLTIKQREELKNKIGSGNNLEVLKFFKNYFTSALSPLKEVGKEDCFEAFSPDVKCYCKFCDESFDDSYDATDHSCPAFNFNEAIIPMTKPVIKASQLIIELLESSKMGPEESEIYHTICRILGSGKIEREEKRDLLGDYLLSILSFVEINELIRSDIIEMIKEERMEFLIPIRSSPVNSSWGEYLGIA